MLKVVKSHHNPILGPNPDQDWEAQAAYNGCPIEKDGKIHLLYRGLSNSYDYQGKNVELSVVGKAVSEDGVNFDQRQLFIRPDQDWDRYGCEDPRVTKFEDNYYIFYTAIADYPPNPSVIKIGLAISPDLETITEKHLVTTFNSKAMFLFPERIEGKISAILTAETDQPPVNIAIAQFNQIDQVWDQNYWRQWYEELEIHTLRLRRRPQDHVEIGGTPIKTKKGWLLLYSYINNYFNVDKRIFSVEALLLDLEDPRQIIGRSKFPLLVPEKKYELEGTVPNIIFPGGVLRQGDNLKIYYGGADTCCCLAGCSIKSLLEKII